jgi:hypothetical protein
MLAGGFSVKSIRKIVFWEHSRILLYGIFTGIISALVATRPSLLNDSDLPWKSVVVMILLVLVTGFAALAASVKSISKDTLINRIRKD